MRDKKAKHQLSLMFVICIAAGMATLLPFKWASETSILGYRSLCTFSPISTTLLFYAGLLIYGKIRKG